MKGSYLGEFQELVLLAVLSLGEDAYGVSVQKQILEVAGREITRGALHSALSRLEEKKFLRSSFGEATQERGGRRKRIYSITTAGESALREAQSIREKFTHAVNPSFQYG